MNVAERRMRSETRISYGSTVHVLIKDLRTSKEQTRKFTSAECTLDVLSALVKLRGLRLEPGKSTEFAIANERKSAAVRVESQARERLRTGTRDMATIRHEVHMMNDVLYRRKGRLFVWLSDDADRIPVRIRLQLPFYIGTVTLELENRQ
jgi:hypothetical protein